MSCLRGPTYQPSLEKEVMSLMPGASDPIFTGTFVALQNRFAIFYRRYKLNKKPMFIKKSVKIQIKTDVTKNQELEYVAKQAD